MDRYYGLIKYFCGSVIFLIIVVAGLIKKSNRSAWVNTDEFSIKKKKMKPFCSKKEFDEFFNFLQTYEGGYIRRKKGEIIFRDYSGEEKGILKGIFFNVVANNPNITSGDKERFRYFLQSIGIFGVAERPEYETRDSKLKNKKTDIDEYKRKEVGNIGEKLVRNILNDLNPEKYMVLNGPVLKKDGVVKEFDHIVLGHNGCFVIETKAFGMSDGRPCKSCLFIDKGDKWIIRKNKNNRDLESPTAQIKEEKQILEIIIDLPINIHPILVLSNSELFVKQNIKLDYDVVVVDKLQEFIENYDDRLLENDKLMILQSIDQARIN